jgi:hypothetical protein
MSMQMWLIEILLQRTWRPRCSTVMLSGWRLTCPQWFFHPVIFFYRSYEGLHASKTFLSHTEIYQSRMLTPRLSPLGTTAADIRKSKPTLFLAILSASSGMNYPDLQKMLTKEVMTIYADRIICNGEKTLEIIQALHVSTLWYWPPEHFEELKFYQLIHIAAVMAIDIGMGKKSKCSKTKHAGLWRDHPWRRTPYPDPESIESRRAWLSCYFLCCNASMGLRRP